MLFTTEVLKVSKTVSDHIDLMDFLNHNEEPFLKALGEPFTNFLWQMMADKDLTAVLNKFVTEEGQVVYSLGMSMSDIDYILTSPAPKPPEKFSDVQRQAHMWNLLGKTMVTRGLSVLRHDGPSLASFDALEAYLTALMDSEKKNA